ncbi:MAG: hypothetical protein LBO69_06025, partial [Ignavibacteria bacterium]|nr:hypothetical protein [Ignavibacteria bacterium]MDR0927307.1 hypothetical protein [Ignavibacteria bacterium]
MFTNQRLKYESVTKYQWFEFYCASGTTRTLQAVTDHFNVEYRKVMRASAKWNWLTRAHLYDEYQQQLNDENRYKEIDALKEVVEK